MKNTTGHMKDRHSHDDSNDVSCFGEKKIKKLFEMVRNGEISVEDALGEFKFLPYEDMGFAKVDHHRHLRQGFPERWGLKKMNYRKRTRKPVQLETWTSPEVKGYTQKNNSVAIIPLGSFEQHGPHAPLGTDTFISAEVCKRLAAKLGGVVLPPVWFGISVEHMDFPGTITVSPDTLCNLLVDIVNSLKAGGFRKIVIINGHGSNRRYLEDVKEKAAEKVGDEITLLAVSYWDMLPEKDKRKLCSLEWGLHANEYETSIISAILPSMVKKLRNTANFPDISDAEHRKIDVNLFRELIRDSNGIWGDPDRASIKKGRSFLAVIELTLTNYLVQALKLSESGLTVNDMTKNR